MVLLASVDALEALVASLAGALPWTLGLLTSLGLVLALLSWTCQRRLLAIRAPSLDGGAPPVSILKPLRGADAGLHENLASFFALEAVPEHELVFGARDADDPALAVVERLRRAHPDQQVRIVVSSDEVGLNPKVNNLANMARHARHEVLLISDSNVRVTPGYLADMVARLQRPSHGGRRVGLVSSLIRGASGRGLGGALEQLQLNTFVMGGVATVATELRLPCVVGKSMLFRRTDLERIGGWSFLGRFLAEDQACGEEMSRLGLAVEVSGRPVDNVLGRLSVREFVSRHLRWARIRRHVSPLGYVAEAFANPVAPALLAAALLRTPASLAIAAAALASMGSLAWTAQRRLGLALPLVSTIALEALRSVLVAAVWPVPFFSSTVTWRGHRLRIRRRSLLVDSNAPEAVMPRDHGTQHLVPRRAP